MYIRGNYSLWIGAAARQRHRQPGGPPSINHGGDELRTHIPGCHLFPGPVGEVRIELQKFIGCEPRFLEPAGLAVYRRHKRSEEHTSELQSLMRISYAVFCFKK